MEVHQLRYFCAIVTSGTFTNAARAVHISQPSLSQQIIKLEDELGGKLFYRLPRSARLTALGELFLPRALAILKEIRECKAEIQKLVDVQKTESNRHPILTKACEPRGGAAVTAISILSRSA